MICFLSLADNWEVCIWSSRHSIFAWLHHPNTTTQIRDWCTYTAMYSSYNFTNTTNWLTEDNISLVALPDPTQLNSTRASWVSFMSGHTRRRAQWPISSNSIELDKPIVSFLSFAEYRIKFKDWLSRIDHSDQIGRRGQYLTHIGPSTFDYGIAVLSSSGRNEWTPWT